MVVRKAQDGSLKPMMLNPDNVELAQKVIDLYRSSIGMTKKEIMKGITNIEYGVRNPKIVRGLALIMERTSIFKSRSKVSSKDVRDFLFQLGPAVTPEERYERIKLTAKHFSVSPEDIEDAIYGDMDSENVLEECSSLSALDLNRRFNLEQLTTLMYRARYLEVSGVKDWYRFISMIKGLGLVFEARGNPLQSVRIDGPNSIFNNMDRYGSSIARAVERLTAFEDWTLSAEIAIKDRISSISIDSSIKYYLPEMRMEETDKFPDPVVVGTRVFFPTRIIEVNGKPVYLDVVYHMSPEAIRKRDDVIRSAGIRWITAVVGDCKKFQNIPCFRNKVDWDSLISYASKAFPAEIDPLKDEIDALYPNIDAIMDLLYSRGVPISYLERIGYRIKWNGILPEIYRE
ncbi:hypothetical protein DMB44_06135 [Thermoplasma sp. Kam2015]|uniref:DUF790 family protein n=1 Tax=Thermoplasma sp. Kam2015 TaxID=2094122 RepID=UPI000D9B1065|nr:DUF790 family protein [Thermoplasma sp. Kam2015]PYB68074.1 hypothetical protein DMB44_06135 [Thermoplasma sp. Kam2015]